MPQTLTERQQEIFEFIEQYQVEHGCSPKIMELQKKFEIKSVNGVIKHLRALEKKGWIIRDNTPRGIGLLERARQKIQSTMVSVPIFGTIPAGNPQDVQEMIEGYQSVDSSLLRTPGKAFALIVKGESMVDAGIVEGDVVVLEQKEPKHFDIVAALVDGASTLKRFIKEKDGRTFLHAENKEYPDIHPSEELIIQGVAVYLIRKL